MRHLPLLAVVLLPLSAGCLRDLVPEHASSSTPASMPDMLPPPGPSPSPSTSPSPSPMPGDGASGAFSLTLEGEAATLTAPMAAMSDGNASGGQYIVVPAGGTGGKAVFTVSVPHDGQYNIWGRVLAPADANNSFHLSIDNDTVDNDASDGTSTIWDLTITTTWAWNRTNMRVDAMGTDQAQTYTLTAGAHTLYLNEREDSTQLDKLLITDDLNMTPTN